MSEDDDGLTEQARRLLTQTERDLIQDGFVEVTPRGRTLTDYGTDRALQLAAANEKEQTA